MLNSSNEITNEIKTDGLNRVSSLIAVIENNKNFKYVFDDIKFNIINDKTDDEIIASGIKTLNINFNFTENNKLINSSVKLSFNLQGKSRKEINQYLADNLSEYLLNFKADYILSTNFFAQTVFANNKSTYQDLINELKLFDSKNNSYLWVDIFKKFDNSDSRINLDFEVDDKISEELNRPLAIPTWLFKTTPVIYI